VGDGQKDLVADRVAGLVGDLAVDLAADRGAGQALAIGLAGGANKGPNGHRVELRQARVKRIFGEGRRRVPEWQGLTLEAEIRRLSDCRVLRRCDSAQPRVSGSRFRPAD
jgi:hypothetical protein